MLFFTCTVLGFLGTPVHLLPSQNVPLSPHIPQLQEHTALHSAGAWKRSLTGWMVDGEYFGWMRTCWENSRTPYPRRCGCSPQHGDQKVKVEWRNNLLCPIVEFHIGETEEQIVSRLCQGLTLKEARGHIRHQPGKGQ